MSLDLSILASGSGGNCSVVRTPNGLLLLDAGLGPRVLAQRLAHCGLQLNDVSAACLTHLDRDHLHAGFMQWLARRQLPLYCHQEKVSRLREIARRECCALNIQQFGHEPFEPVQGLHIEPLPLAHDVDGSHGFVLSSTQRLLTANAYESRTQRIGFATDLGRVPPTLIDRFSAGGGLDILAIESNYCPQLQHASPRPEFLKRRIMGGSGHLSNSQAFAAVRLVLNQHEALQRELPASIALLHRSRQCNCPDRVRDVFGRDARIAPRLVLAEQDAPTGWLKTRCGRAAAVQLLFAWE